MSLGTAPIVGVTSQIQGKAADAHLRCLVSISVSGEVASFNEGVASPLSYLREPRLGGCALHHNLGSSAQTWPSLGKGFGG